MGSTTACAIMPLPMNAILSKTPSALLLGDSVVVVAVADGLALNRLVVSEKSGVLDEEKVRTVLATSRLLVLLAAALVANLVNIIIVVVLWLLGCVSIFYCVVAILWSASKLWDRCCEMDGPRL